jgi:hypothetical protein
MIITTLGRGSGVPGEWDAATGATLPATRIASHVTARAVDRANGRKGEVTAAAYWPEAECELSAMRAVSGDQGQPNGEADRG